VAAVLWFTGARAPLPPHWAATPCLPHPHSWALFLWQRSCTSAGRRTDIYLSWDAFYLDMDVVLNSHFGQAWDVGPATGETGIRIISVRAMAGRQEGLPWGCHTVPLTSLCTPFLPFYIYYPNMIYYMQHATAHSFLPATARLYCQLPCCSSCCWRYTPPLVSPIPLAGRSVGQLGDGWTWAVDWWGGLHHNPPPAPRPHPTPPTHAAAPAPPHRCFAFTHGACSTYTPPPARSLLAGLPRQGW